MKRTYFPPLGRDISRLVLGAISFNLEEEGLERTFALMDAWRERGGNIVDTAHIYAGGNSERALGPYLEERGCRDELVILTKGAHHNADRNRVAPEDITCDLRDSLARLRTDTIDLYLLHRDDPNVEVGPIVECLNEHRTAGRIRAFGGSNWSPERLDSANEYAGSRGLEPFSVSSPNLSLAVPKEPPWPGCLHAMEPETMAWYARTGMPLFAWSSQARGFFSGRYTPENINEDALMERVYDSPANWERYRRAQELGRRKGATATQICLAWVLHQPVNVFPLIGPVTVEELDSCLEALDLVLTPDEVRWLSED